MNLDTTLETLKVRFDLVHLDNERGVQHVWTSCHDGTPLLGALESESAVRIRQALRRLTLGETDSVEGVFRASAKNGMSRVLMIRGAEPQTVTRGQLLLLCSVDITKLPSLILDGAVDS